MNRNECLEYVGKYVQVIRYDGRKDCGFFEVNVENDFYIVDLFSKEVANLFSKEKIKEGYDNFMKGNNLGWDLSGIEQIKEISIDSDFPYISVHELLGEEVEGWFSRKVIQA